MAFKPGRVPDIDRETTKYSPLKMYVDASVETGHYGDDAGIGIVIRDHCGRELGRYCEFIGRSYHSNAAEQAALDKAIHIAEILEGVEHVKFYTDSMGVAEGEYSLPQLAYGTVEHIDREENDTADLLATAGRRRAMTID